MTRVFIDGSAGTTGLKIEEYLAGRDGIERITLGEEVRKDAAARARCLNEADIAILCLPDVAAHEAVGWIANPKTRVIDASTAHRVAPGWVYGLPELEPGQRERIRTAQRLCVGGCHATAFILALRPLVDAGLVPTAYPVTAQSLTGYSGGGKPLIARFEEEPGERLAICPYALGLAHKHLPEMQRYARLEAAPLFLPAVGNFYQGLVVTVPLHCALAPRLSPDAVYACLQDRYAGERAVRVWPLEMERWLDDGLLSPIGANGTNRVDLFVAGHAEQVAVLARLDNLGKGAAGAAVQCLNLMLDRDEFEGLRLE